MISLGQLFAPPVFVALGLMFLAIPNTTVCTVPYNTMMGVGVVLLFLGTFGTGVLYGIKDKIGLA